MIKQYRKKSIQSMQPWTPDADMSRVSVSASDRESGSPKSGDMIAFDPKASGDRWLIAADFFLTNYEEVQP